MIIPNGTIEVREKNAGGINETTGFPIDSFNKSWSDPQECQYLPSRVNILAVAASGSAYKQATYDILVEMPETLPFNGEQIRLKDDSGNTIGEYSIISVIELRAVNQLKITV